MPASLGAGTADKRPSRKNNFLQSGSPTTAAYSTSAMMSELSLAMEMRESANLQREVR